jgi:thiol-disulfide isomerase/thioredoxin
MNKNQKIILIISIAFVVLGVIATYFYIHFSKVDISEEAVSTFSNKEGEDPYTDLYGNPVTLDSYLGKYIVATSWASWSPFSENDLRNFEELAQNYKDREVVFMAINRKETKEQALRYLNTQPEFSNIVIALDPRDNFYKATGGYAMPEIVTYNKKGEVIDHFRGVVERDNLIKAIDELITK